MGIKSIEFLIDFIVSVMDFITLFYVSEKKNITPYEADDMPLEHI